ncbi:hypothetical protein JHK82_016352 [Glycine max]|nr:hypothetical protein JHK82_016352 [Glycine max]
MKNKIFDLVEDSHEGDNYLKALECLVALARVASLSSKAIQLPSKHSKEYSGGVNRVEQRKNKPKYPSSARDWRSSERW